ncbi:MAG: DUF92 domain-containing protein, partial [Nitrososphaerales archaeon]
MSSGDSPLSDIPALFGRENHSMTALLELLLGILLIAALAIIAVRVGAIDTAGAASGGVITLIAFLAGGFGWLIIIVIFFAVSSLLTRYRYEYKKKIGSAQEKAGRRSWPNSLANAGIALFASLGELYFHSDLFALAFVTSIASAMADTLATEIGVLSHSTPRMITNLRKSVSAGTSGGVTLLGGVAALSASAFIALVGLSLSMFPSGLNFALFGFVSVVVGAMIGTGFDSFLGATIQSLNKCSVCGQFTESSEHHDQKT